MKKLIIAILLLVSSCSRPDQEVMVDYYDTRILIQRDYVRPRTIYLFNDHQNLEYEINEWKTEAGDFYWCISKYPKRRIVSCDTVCVGLCPCTIVAYRSVGLMLYDLFIIDSEGMIVYWFDETCGSRAGDCTTWWSRGPYPDKITVREVRWYPDIRKLISKQRKKKRRIFTRELEVDAGP